MSHSVRRCGDSALSLGSTRSGWLWVWQGCPKACDELEPDQVQLQDQVWTWTFSTVSGSTNLPDPGGSHPLGAEEGNRDQLPAGDGAGLGAPAGQADMQSLLRSVAQVLGGNAVDGHVTISQPSLQVRSGTRWPGGYLGWGSGCRKVSQF